MHTEEMSSPEDMSYEDNGSNNSELIDILTQESSSFDQDDNEIWGDDFKFIDLNHKEFDNGLKLKCDIFSLEFPFFLLSKGKLPDPETKIIDCEDLDFEWNSISDGDYSKSIKAVASARYGMPTIYDKNILVFVTSCIVHLKNIAKKNKERFNVRKIRFLAGQFFKVFKKSDGGESYKRILLGLKRLRHTAYETNVKQKNFQIFDDFQFFENIRIVKVENKYCYIEVTISEWLFDAINKNQILTLHPDYTDLPPIQKRIYEVARKHCGNQTSVEIGIDKFQKKLNVSSGKEFRRNINNPDTKIPEYVCEIENKHMVKISQKDPNKILKGV
ncbi:MAG TPA: replication initiator protein A [Methylotenera sp.]